MKSHAVSTGCAGQTFLTLTTDTDTVVGTVGSDTITGTATTWVDGDSVLDASTTDNDTYNLSIEAADAAAHKVVNIENINITMASTSAPTSGTGVVASSYSGVKNLTVTRSNLSVGGSSIVGNKAVEVTGVDATKVAAVTTGTGTTTVVVAQTNKAGVTVNADTATGAASGSAGVTITGAATVNAANATGTVAITALSDTTEDAKAVTVNAAKANSVTTASGLTGAIAINAAAATTVDVDNATGGLTLNAAKSTSTSVGNIDDSGATLNLGTYTRAAKGDINLEGTSDTTDVATISAAGFVTLSTDADGSGATHAIENINISGNGAALTATFDNSSSGLKKVTVTGSQDVRLEVNSDDLAAATVTNSGTGNLTVAFNSALTSSGSTAIDFSKVSAKTIEFAADLDNDANSAATFASGTSIVLSKDQSDIYLASKTTKGTLSIAAGDDTLSSETGLPSGATVEITTQSISATSVDALNLDATTGKLTVDKLSTASTTVVTLTGTKDVSIDGDYVASGVGQTLSTVTAKSLNAANFSGELTINLGTGLNTLYGGSGVDTVVVDDGVVTRSDGTNTVALTNATATVYTVDLGTGANVLTITSAADLSSFATGSGADTINVNDDNKYVIVAGAGNDTVNLGGAVDTDAIIVGGEGTDSLVFGAGTVDLSRVGTSGNENFTVSGFETIDITAVNGTVTINNLVLANAGAFTLAGGTDDLLTIKGRDLAGSTADTLDASLITRANSDVTVTLEGGAGNDTVTGTAKNDTIIGGLGADTINGGSGTDTVTYGSGITYGTDADVASSVTGADVIRGVVVNLGATAVTKDAVFAGVGKYAANGLTEVAAGTAAYTFDTSTNTKNSTNVDTLTSIENVIGGSGRDYIVGTAGNNEITGAGGADFINVGLGTDKVIYTAHGDSYSGTITDAVTVLSGSVDVVAGMGNGDTIQLADITLTAAVSNASLDTTILAAGGTTTADDVNLIRGTYDAATGIFTRGTTSGDNDYLLQALDTAPNTETVMSVVLLDITGTVTYSVSTAGLVTLGVA